MGVARYGLLVSDRIIMNLDGTQNNGSAFLAFFTEILSFRKKIFVFSLSSFSLLIPSVTLLLFRLPRAILAFPASTKETTGDGVSSHAPSPRVFVGKGRVTKP